MSRVSLFALFFLAGCGYSLIDPSATPATIHIPFIQGDMDGELTQSLIKEFSQSIGFRPSTSGRYTLEVTFLSSKDENVGFRYDQNSDGDLLTTVIPSETRSSLLVEVSLLDNYKGCILFGPARVSASHTFDHDWYSSWDGVNVFSMGQVTDFFDAKDGIYPILAKKLAQKIVDLLDQVDLP